MNRITELRKKHGISQKKLGSIIGVAQNTVCNWEKENRQPDYNAVRKMAALFNVSIDYLLGVSPEEKKPPTEIDEGLGDIEEQITSYITNLTLDQKHFLLAQLKTMLEQEKVLPSDAP